MYLEEEGQMINKSKYKKIVLSMIPNEPCNINSTDIAKNTCIPSRNVRLIIQALRDDGHPICSTPENGYWIARSSYDLNETMKKLQNHINSCQMTLDALTDCQRKLRECENLEDN